MSKELPYFKFEPNQWENGSIQMCSKDVKGLFIDICSVYWSRLGELPYALALQKHCNGDAKALQTLIEYDIIGHIDGQIIIEFLDEQLNEFQETSIKRREAANKRWSNASAMQVQCKSNAIREEKRREEEIKEDNSKKEIVYSTEIHGCYQNCIVHFSESLRPKNQKQIDSWLDTIEKLNRIDNLDFPVIERIVELARKDDFWAKNFLSLTKLRKTNKDGLKYVVVFHEKFKNNGNNQQKGVIRTDRLAETFSKHFSANRE